MRHLMSPLDFSVEELDKLLDLANDIEAHPEKYAHKCDGKKLATCFYEPSTRTRLSFEAAMLNLGGSVLGFHSADSSSASKGESVSDTIRVISCYADICAMRHPKEGAPLVASEKSRIPVINAGDGGHQHPTQTLADLLTIRSIKGRLNNITIGFCGDLKFGRTVHSLINALIRYDNVKIVLISPEELKVPDYVRDDVLRDLLRKLPRAPYAGIVENAHAACGVGRAGREQKVHRPLDPVRVGNIVGVLPGDVCALRARKALVERSAETEICFVLEDRDARCMMRHVSSVEASSQRMSSRSRYVCARTDAAAFSSVGAPLYTLMRTETSPASQLGIFPLLRVSINVSEA